MNRKQAITIVIFCVWMSVLAVRMPAQQLPFVNYTAGDGLAGGSVYAFLQDSRGFLWLGTWGGLIQFDGYKFRNFTVADGLIDNRVESLEEDRYGRIWIGTAAGMCVYDYTQNQSSNLTTVDDLVPETFFVMEHDASHNIWIAADTTIFRYDGVNGALCPVNLQIAPSMVQALKTDHLGNLWIGTNAGLIRQQGGNVTQRYTEVSGRALPSVLSLETDSSGRLWIGTEQGVYRLDDGRLTKIKGIKGLTDAKINAMACDSSGHMWFGTTSGVVKYDGEQCRTYTTVHGLAGDNITEIFVDNEANLWFGTDGDGISRLNGEHLAFFSRGNNLVLSNLNTIEKDLQGGLWVGGGVGAMRLDGSERSTFSVVPVWSGVNVYTIRRNRTGHLWFGSDAGARFFDGRRYRTYTQEGGLIDNRVHAICIDRRDRIWFGTDNGVSCLDGTMFQQCLPGEYLLAGISIRAILEGRSGVLWFCTYGRGIVRLDEDNVTSYTVQDGLAHNDVWSASEDTEGNFWFSTINGLSKYDGHRFRSFTTADGLSHNDCRFTVQSGRSLYIGTLQGICRLNLDTESIESFLPNFHSKENAVFKDDTGNLWFGSKRMGLIRFNPQLLRINRVPPPVHITGLRMLHHPMAIHDGERFSYRQNQMTIDFVGLCFSAPEAVLYRYRLNGIEETPVETMDRSAAYTYLPPGDYQFQVEARNNDGVWSATPATWAFTIAPPFWKTWWFRLASGLWLLVMIIGAHHVRTKVHIRRNRLLEAEVQHRTAELQSAKQTVEEAKSQLENRVRERTGQLRTMASQLTITEEQTRQRIALDLHDRIAQSLTMAKLKLVMTRRELPAQETNQQLNDSIALIEQTIRDTRSLIIDLSPPILHTLGLTAALERLAEETTQKNAIPVQFHVEGKARQLEKNLRALVYRAIGELLANVIKHANAQSVEVGIFWEGEQVRIIVRDDGNGFDTSCLRDRTTIARRFGLFSYRERLEYFSGQLQLESTPRSGTTAILTAPVMPLSTDESSARP